MITLMTRLWLGWWWDGLFLHFLSPLTTNRVGQVQKAITFSSLSYYYVSPVKVHHSKEETPAHSRHPLPPIFLSPTSSRYLKVINDHRSCKERKPLIQDFQERRMETAVNQWKKRTAMSRLQVFCHSLSYEKEDLKVAKQEGQQRSFVVSGSPSGRQVQRCSRGR